MLSLIKKYVKRSITSFQFGKKKQQDIEDLKALISLQPLAKSYIPWTESAVKPAALALIINDILINDRKTIVELGGGITTLFISNLLSTLCEDRKLITIEHDKEWIKVLHNNLSMFANPDNVELIHAGLKECEYTLDQSKWYDGSCVEKAIAERKIDLLIVDGPPAYSQYTSLSRYPALPTFIDSLSENCSIFLDDGNRTGEKKIADLWEKKYHLKIHRRSGNMLIATRGKSWNIH